MKSFSEAIRNYETATAKEPRFVLQLSWDEADTDWSFFKSSKEANDPTDLSTIRLVGLQTARSAFELIQSSDLVVAGVQPGDFVLNISTQEWTTVRNIQNTLTALLWEDIFASSPATDAFAIYAPNYAIPGTVQKISGQTQQINPDIATSTIGTVAITLQDNLERENLLIWSEDVDQGGWAFNNLTASLAYFTGPYWNANKLTATSTDPYCYQAYDTGEALGGRTFTYRVVAWTDTAEPKTARLFIYDASVGDIGFKYITLTTEPKEFFITHEFGAGEADTSVTARIDIADPAVASPGDYLYATQHQLSETKAVVAYTRTQGTRVLADRNVITNIINEKLEAGDGLRGKIARLYVGYETMRFAEYDLRLTYIVDSITYRDGIYTLQLADVQRQERKKIFTPDETTLASSITATDLVIPVTTSDATKFPLVTHGSEWTVRPSQTVGYVKIKDEVMCHSGLSFSTTDGWHLTVVERGALNTAPEPHTIEDGTDDNRKPKIEEHIYLEGPAPKILYALYTGILLNGSPADALPSHWHMGIDSEFVSLSDHQNIGVDFWDTSDDSGRFIRIENPGTQDGKQFVEKQILLWMGAFAPIYSTGEIGLKRLKGILSDSSYQAKLGAENVKSYGELKHDMRAVINNIRIYWNWVDSKQDYTKEALLIDQESIDTHLVADEKEYKFTTVHTGIHTDEDLLTYFDILRDRYSGPPLKIDVTVMPSMSHLEVGDVVQLELDQIRDFNSNSGVTRPFEIQQIATDWTTGDIKLQLFGSSQKAGELSRTTLSSVLLDAFYTNEGTSLDSADSPAGPLTIVAGAVTANGTVTGHATNNKDSTAIYYYDGNLTINAGVTVTIEENVQLRIKGTLQINGTIDGAGNGATGGAGVSTYANGTTYDFFKVNYPNPNVERSGMDSNKGEQGYFGTTIAPDPLNHSSGRVGSTFWPEQRTSEGVVSEVPFYQLTNDQQTNSLTGYPDDIRGNSGCGGMGYEQAISWFNDPVKTTDFELLAAGGAGGDGGAGLVIIARGLAFGGSGKIDLSGGDSAAGVEFDLNDPASRMTQYPGGHYISAGPGAPGAPGALVVLMDGDATNPDITTANFIANYGSTNKAAGVVEITRAELNQLTIEGKTYYNAGVDTYPYDHSHLNGGEYGALEDESKSFAAHKIIYIPPDETPVNDDSNFPLYTDGNFHDLLFFQRDATPVAQTGFGRDVDVTSDGSRFIASSFSSTVTRTVEVVRSISNPVREQTLSSVGAGVSSSWGDRIAIDDDGARIIIANKSATGVSSPALSAAGLMFVYTRSGTTWSLEQQIEANSPNTNGFFGENFSVDDAMEHMLIKQDPGSGYELEYWSRSGTTWTYQQTLTKIAGSTSWGITFAISGDGNWLVVGDTAHGTRGGIHLYSRSGSTWTLETSFEPIGLTSTGSFGRSEKMNYDGSTIVTRTNGTATDQYIAVMKREDTTIIQKQAILYDPSTATPNPKTISSDGLVMLVHEPNVSEEVQVYRRGSPDQGFKLEQTLTNKDDGAWGIAETARMARDGSYLITGNTAVDIGAANAGAIHAWQFFPKPR